MHWRFISLAAISLACLAQTDPARAQLEASERALAAGQYQAAIDQGNAAAQAFASRHDAAAEGDALNVVGRALWFRGDADGALPVLQKALQRAKDAHDADQEIGRLNNVANVYFVQGRYLNALRGYEAAMDRVKQTSVEAWNPRRRALTSLNLAVLYQQLGQNDRALTLYKEARAIPNALPAAEQAQLLSNMGTLYRRLGDPDRALESYRAAQVLFEKEHQADAEIHILQNIGIVRALDLKDYDGALAVFTEALERSKRIHDDPQTTLGSLFRGETYLRMRRFENARDEFGQAYANADRMKAQEELWTALYGLGRVQRETGELEKAMQSFRAAIEIIETLRTGLSSTTLRSQFLANKRDVYDAAVALLLAESKPRIEEIFGLMEQERARSYKDVLPATASRVSLPQVQARLAPRTALLMYWQTRENLAVLWATRDSSGIRSMTPDRIGLAQIAELAKRLQDPHDQTWRELSRSAGNLLLREIAPVADRSLSKCIIVPDGALYFLPFEALTVPGSNELLIDRVTTWYLPSAASLALEQTRDGLPKMPWQVEAAAFGNPQVKGQEALLPFDEAWSELPYSGVELKAVSSLLRGKVKQYSGPDDRKSAFLALSGARVSLIHVSTHAAVDLADPSQSRMLFSPGPEGNSQYLFWPEAQKLDFKGVDLVTLSACDTEAGKIVLGDGIQSFSRAFLGAGAAATVTTLWRVADQPTSEFMKQFYFQISKGRPKGEALRAAKLKFLHSSSDLAHPANWAAFVLNGEGSQAVPDFISWTSIGLAFAVVAIAAGLIIGRRRGQSPAR